MNKSELKKITNQLKPQFFIGKSGITQEFITTIKDYLDKHHIVKIKSNTATNSGELKTQIEELKQRLNCTSLDIKGFTFCLFKDD